MATIAPMAEWKPFTGKGSSTLTHDIICAHTMVGKLMGSWDWANQSGNAYWHYGLGADGRLLQCHPLEYRSAANLDGNWHVIPIETEDGYSDGRTSDAGQVWSPWSGSNVPSWTNAQMDKLVDLCAWLCVRYNIPPVLIPDTKPGRRGLAYHRQGIDPWRVSGGEKWSNSTGKVCPGDRRLDQWVNVVIPRIKTRVEGGEEDVPNTPEEIADGCATALRRMTRNIPGVGGGTDADAVWAKYVYDGARESLGDVDMTPESIAAAVVAALPPSAGGEGLTVEDVEAAVRTVFADAGTE
jgi:hypothetical protein